MNKPTIGDRKRIGKPSVLLEWATCIDCGKERWVKVEYDKPKSIRCRKCESTKRRGQSNKWWGGGRNKDIDGYIQVRLYPDDFFYPMARKSHYVFEHRLVMAKHLERCLLKTEQVHHLNGIKDDNRIENLELMPDISKHSKFTTCSNCELRKEIRLLRWQVKELSAQAQGNLFDNKERSLPCRRREYKQKTTLTGWAGGKRW